MPSAIVFITARQNGSLVAVHRDGGISEQKLRDGAVAGDYRKTWRPVPLDGLDGRVTGVTVSYDDRLCAVTSAGGVYEQVAAPGRRQDIYHWRAVPAEE